MIFEEIKRLQEVGFIREVMYPIWLTNIVMIPKKNGKLQICIDFKELNKVCLKDSFTLPKIDQ